MSALPLPFPGWGKPLLGGTRYTATDAERMPDDGFRYEVFRGVMIRMPGTGEDHAFICQFVGRIIEVYWRERGERYRVAQNLGVDFTFPEDEPETTMLVPDVAVKADNTRHGKGIAQDPPLVVIEVASPSNYRPEMQIKAKFYLNSGVKEVWVIWPNAQTVDVWTSDAPMKTYTNQDTIVSSHMPGFSSPVIDFFE